MNTKKLIITAICFSSILLLSTIPTVGSSTENTLATSKTKIDTKSNISINATLENKTLFTTTGPLHWTITKIKILNTSSTIEKIRLNLLLRNHLLPRILPFRFNFVKNTSFIIKYKREVWLKNSFKYSTTYGEIQNITIKNESFLNTTRAIAENITNKTNIINEKHTVKVENFNGAVIVNKKPLLRKGIINPERFRISGICDKVTLNP